MIDRDANCLAQALLLQLSGDDGCVVLHLHDALLHRLNVCLLGQDVCLEVQPLPLLGWQKLNAYLGARHLHDIGYRRVVERIV